MLELIRRKSYFLSFSMHVLTGLIANRIYKSKYYFYK